MVQYGEALKRPFQDFKKLGIGILLNIVPIINFFVLGYYLNCAKTAMKKDFKLPEWKNFKNLFVKGLASIGISLIYFIPAIILIVIALFLGASFFITAALTEEILPALPSLAGFGGALLGALFFIILAIYILPVALLQYIEKEKFSDALKLGKVFKKSFQGKYFVVWFIMILYTLLITFILNFHYIGKVIATFITEVTFFTAIGELYPNLK